MYKPSNSARRSSRKASRTRGQNSAISYEKLEPKNLMTAIITEFVASNNNSLTDDNGNSTDWIEIFNPSNQAINLSGYGLTDDASDFFKFVFPDTNLGAGEYLVVFAGNDESPNSGTDIYTGFSLSADGEYLALSDSNGNIASEFSAQQQFTDTSYGVIEFGNFDQVAYFAFTTPGGANLGPFSGVLDRVESDVAAGFYDSTITVTLSTSSSTAQIRYTTDGSTPTATNGTLYTSPISISSTTNLRAVATQPLFLSVPDRTWSYLFLDDILQQSPNGEAPPGFPTQQNAQFPIDYGIDPEVIAIEGEQQIRDALLAIPTLSITTDLDNLFDPETGIYFNAQERGREYERAASIEKIDSGDGTGGFQVNAGLRIRGAFSRRPENPKHSFRLNFRNEYGDSELNYPVHGDEGVDTFRSLDLRTAQNFSWSFNGSSNASFIVDELNRVSQQLLGQPSTLSTWSHLYLNGQYWGLYQTQERHDSNFAASYFGGDAENYDVIRADNFRAAASDGNTEAFHRLHAQALAKLEDGVTPAFADFANFQRAQGLNIDGTRNPDYEVLLDVDNLIAYMLLTLNGGNRDGSIGIYTNPSNSAVNNFFIIRDRTGDEGFKFFVHDAEHTYRSEFEDRTGPFVHPNLELPEFFNAQTLHQRLLASDEYRTAFGDAVQEHYFNGGLFTPEGQADLIDQLAEELDVAIYAESARWGDAQRSSPHLRQTWLNRLQGLKDYATARHSIVINQYQNTRQLLQDTNGNYTISIDSPIFPSVAAPSFLLDGSLQNGGEVDSGSTLSFLNEGGGVYYTTDGSDPRLVGGGINPNAIFFEPSSNITTTVFDLGSEWRFLDDGSDQGTAWRFPSFNDSGFQVGASELGFGDDPTTETNRFDSSGNQVITTYFRKTFEVTESFDTAELELFYDDGAAVYLNGNLVETVNLNGPFNFQTFATTFSVDGSTTFVDLSDFLVEGTNTLAIEVHQFNATSSDLSFNAALRTSSLNNNGLEGIPLTASTNIQARSFSDGEFSGLANATFSIPGVQSDLRISEIHFNPADPTPQEILAGFVDNDDFEFIEIFNPNATNTINLSGAQLSDGVTFNFGDVDLLPGERAVVVEDIDAFMARYGDSDVTILGQYSGGLSNSGEEVVLLDNSGTEVVSVDYSGTDPSLFAADGVGFSLVLDDLGDSSSLRVSAEFGGTPGAASALPSGVVINEVLANSDGTRSDSIELFNTTDAAIDISGYFLSDDSADLLQYQIPAGTIVAPGGYVVFDESEFNATADGFALSGFAGDEVFLSQATLGSLELQDSVQFGATFSGESLGRLPDGSGRLTRLASTSFGSANGEAEVGPLVISEINYHPAEPSAAALAIDPTLSDNDLEFIEIANPTSASIDLTGYRIRGEADFDFAAGTVLAAGQAIIVVTFDPTSALNANRLAAFEAHYGIGANATIVGGLSEALSNSSGRISLQQQDATNLLGEVSFVAIDEVFYTDDAPFADADGSGQSLQRDDLSVSGNIASNWVAVAPTPGEFESEFVLGDSNQDGVVNFSDIPAFINLLTFGDFLDEADINRDGVVNFGDIPFFIDLLTNQ